MNQLDVLRTPRQVAQGLHDWLNALGETWPPVDDARTAAFCRGRVRALADEKVLQAKLQGDLGLAAGRSWRPIGHVLAVVTEEDHLGVVAAMVAAALTGNRLTLKARRHLAVLHHLREALGWGEAQCRLADWDSQSQDDAALLHDVQGVVLAGGEALIRRYRGAAAPGVRLIEYGPRLSAAIVQQWPTEAHAQLALVAALVHDTVLFGQAVCSSPQCVLLPDRPAAQALLTALTPHLDALPMLDESARLQQWRAVQELHALQCLDAEIQVVWSAQSGWAVALADAVDAQRLPRGFRLLVGGLDRLPAHGAMVQTLGVWPDASAIASDAPVFHRCKLGRMHERSLLAPHDGQFELAQWVHFTSLDLGGTAEQRCVS